MAMIKKFYDNSTIFMEVRDDAVAGTVKRLHDWMSVSFNNVSGWTQRPQRCAGALGENAGQAGDRCQAHDQREDGERHAPAVPPQVINSQASCRAEQAGQYSLCRATYPPDRRGQDQHKCSEPQCRERKGHPRIPRGQRPFARGGDD